MQNCKRCSCLDIIGLVLVLVFLQATLAFGQSSPKVIEGSSTPITMNLVSEPTELQFGEVKPLGADEVLDAEGSLTIEVPLTNLGPGKAYNIRLNARLIDPPAYVTGSMEEFVPLMMPGETVRFAVTVSAGELVTTGQVHLRIDHTEKYDRIATPIGLDIPVLALAAPSLEMVDNGIDDDNEYPSRGNGNARIEIGERIELKIMVQNLGIGEARDVKVAVAFPAALSPIDPRPKSLGDMDPGSHKLAEFVFDVPRNYDGGDNLLFYINLIESRRRFSVRDTISLNLDEREKAATDLITTVWKPPVSHDGTIVIKTFTPLKVDVDINIPQAREPNPNGWAVIIGNRNYEEKEHELPHAVHDAQVMRKYVKETLGFPPHQVNPYSKDNASLAIFQRIFGSPGKSAGALAAKLDANSDLIVYYSGHGITDIINDRPFLIPTDCLADEVTNNGYSLDTLLNNLSKLEARSIVVIIDACFSGMSSVGSLVEGASAIEKITTDVTRSAKTDRMAVFSASSGAERANVYEDMKHNVYTYYFLKALQGSADLDGDGLITAGEIHDFVSDKNSGVPDRVQRLYEGRRQQTPEFRGDRSLVIRRIGQ